jgi:hypothetical protein
VNTFHNNGPFLEKCDRPRGFSETQDSVEFQFISCITWFFHNASYFQDHKYRVASELTVLQNPLWGFSILWDLHFSTSYLSNIPVTFLHISSFHCFMTPFIKLRFPFFCKFWVGVHSYPSSTILFTSPRKPDCSSCPLHNAFYGFAISLLCQLQLLSRKHVQVMSRKNVFETKLHQRILLQAVRRGYFSRVLIP